MEQPLDVPVLDARDGFTLRPWRLSDLPLVREASEDDYIPLITTVPSPCTDAAGVAFIERQWSRATTGAGYTFVVVASDGRPVGQVGLWLKDLAQGRASMGYWVARSPGRQVARSARGRGAAVAAVDAVAHWALRTLRIPRLELWIEPGNTASVRTAERAGFQREGLLRKGQQVGDERRDMFMYALRNDGL
ncbi:GNAT family N-acetyltransferase [Streptomyces sp. NPDC057094]|uniref:GNAT family N-acetyltransferase n=1 Tax=Streptomyces sp. NPDC057094 TaxID=3346018 RepID=UPI003626AFEA